MVGTLAGKGLVVHWRKAPYDFYIGRNAGYYGIPEHKAQPEFANPFGIGEDGTREEVIALYEAYLRRRLRERMGLRAKLLLMKNKTLGCWCAPLPCHGTVIHKLIAEFYP